MARRAREVDGEEGTEGRRGRGGHEKWMVRRAPEVREDEEGIEGGKDEEGTGTGRQCRPRRWAGGRHRKWKRTGPELKEVEGHWRM
jgi:hypothetical protein